MIDWTMLGGLAGGVGLFLLGMGLMTDGLKLAAGPALERILIRSTKTRLRGLLSGISVTALVQSSSAVTVATIGFVNAGLLSLGGALWVLFGANVGTTMTGWLVALVGLKFKIDMLALPLIGGGMLFRLTGEGTRRGALGMALAGFGVLFLGIDMLRESFSGLATDFQLPAGDGVLVILMQVMVGILLTVLMQSSSAALTITLTAAQGGLIDAQGAAAVVIGANIGTTVTALIAAIGATPNAKRAAAAHIFFNVLTGVVALLLLPWLLDFLGWLGHWLELDDAPAAQLALFHTVFNVLGIVLIWPFADRLANYLRSCFKRTEEDEARPRYLDKTVLAVPALALDALDREVRRLGEIALRNVRTSLASPASADGKQHNITQLTFAIADFIVQLNRISMPADSARRLPELLRVARYYEAAVELAAEAGRATSEAESPDSVPPSDVLFRHKGQALLAIVDPIAPAEAAVINDAVSDFEADYQQLKAELLVSGAQGRMAVTTMDAHLRAASALRRALEQAAKAARLLGCKTPSVP